MSGTILIGFLLLVQTGLWQIFPRLCHKFLAIKAMASSSEKDVYNIRKFDGTNFPIWKEQIHDVLIQKGQLEPLMDREEGMYTDGEWKKLDAKARSTIRLHLAESVYFTIVGEPTAKAVWDKLCANYESKSASNKVYLMKKLFDLRMKEGTNVTSHLNEFNIIFTQLISQGLEFGEEVKCIFMLCSLPPSWDTFCTAISNSAPGTGLVYNDVIGSLLTEEIRRKSMESTKQGDAYVASDGKQRGRTRNREKSKERGRSRSKSRGSTRDIECYYCGKKGHMKKDCHAWQRDKKKQNANKQSDSSSTPKDKEKAEELNVVESPSMLTLIEDMPATDILVFTANIELEALVAQEASADQNWVIDSGASFHVTPHREWFSTYAPMHGIVKLGDAYELEICGMGDIKLVLRNGTEFMLRNVRHVPKLAKSLISAGQLDDMGYTTSFGNGSWVIKKGNLVILRGHKFGTLYSMHVSHIQDDYISIAELPNTELWHSRLGHMSQKGMKQLERSGYLPMLSFSDFSICEHCIYGKQTRTTSPSLDRKRLQPTGTCT